MELIGSEISSLTYSQYSPVFAHPLSGPGQSDACANDETQKLRSSIAPTAPITTGLEKGALLIDCTRLRT